MQKILVPTDFSDSAGKAVMYAAEIASKNGAAIYLLHVIAMITYPKSFWERLMKRSVTKKMAFHSKIPLQAIPALT
jgi:hypothetical protein